MPLSSTGSSASPFGFAGAFGYQEDGDSGLKLLGHRYYDPSTGRFLTRDPAQDGRNWYGYCEGNSLDSLDPEGLKVRFGGTADQKTALRSLFKKVAACPSTRQMCYDLVKDPFLHTMRPVKPGVLPTSSIYLVRLDVPGSETWVFGHGRDVWLDPYSTTHSFLGGRVEIPFLPGISSNRLIPTPPDVALAHELGHLIGKDDEKEGMAPCPGYVIADVENPYRAWRGIPKREIY